MSKVAPSKERARELSTDYARMRPMFFRDPPAWTNVLDRLKDLEGMINEF